MRLMAALFMVLAPAPCLADTYLCIPDAGAVVLSGVKSGIRSMVVEEKSLLNYKLLLSNASGRYTVSMHGETADFLNRCFSTHFCESEDDNYRGHFIRDKNNIFTASWMTRDGDDDVSIVVKGRCTLL